MTNTKSSIRLLVGAAMLTGTIMVVGCGSSERVVKTTTTEQSTVAVPAPAVSSTTTTTQQVRQ